MNRIDGELLVAARENNLPEVSRLLSVGADVNAKDSKAGHLLAGPARMATFKLSRSWLSMEQTLKGKTISAGRLFTVPA
jgi:hypothetical protein